MSGWWIDIVFSQLVIYSGFSFLFQAIFSPSTRGTSSEGSVQVMTWSLMPPNPRIITNSIKTTRHFPLGEEEITEACLAQACELGFICLCLCVSVCEYNNTRSKNETVIALVIYVKVERSLRKAWVNGTLIFLAPLLSRGWCLWISSWICIPQIMRCALEWLSFISPEKGHWPSVAGDHLTRGQIKSLHFSSLTVIYFEEEAPSASYYLCENPQLREIQYAFSMHLASAGLVSDLLLCISDKKKIKKSNVSPGMLIELLQFHLSDPNFVNH